jgi:hypothetical protein
MRKADFMEQDRIVLLRPFFFDGGSGFELKDLVLLGRHSVV